MSRLCFPVALRALLRGGRGTLAGALAGALGATLLMLGSAHAAESASVAPLGLPAPGVYEATLCTAASALADPGCSAVQLQVRPLGRWRLQIHDLVYHLRLRGPELDLALMHGSMQIDEMAVAYRWADGRLQFIDPLKNTRYEIRPGRRL
jgi:hypothetical protein